MRRAASVSAVSLASAMFAWFVCLPAAAGLEDAIVRVKPSIVAVGTFEPTRNPQFAFRGTGFVVGDGMLVATNAHVLPDTVDAEKREVIAVTIPAVGERPSQRRDARVVAVDQEHDLALLRISPPALPALPLQDAELPKEGQSVAFTGFPIGAVLGLIPTTHRATISAITPIAIPMEHARDLNARLIRELEKAPTSVLQLDGTSYPGNSGSPLYDVDTGQVVGIMNMVFVKSTREAVLSQPSGISFAIPASYLGTLLRRVQ